MGQTSRRKSLFQHQVLSMSWRRVQVSQSAFRALQRPSWRRRFDPPRRVAFRGRVGKPATVRNRRRRCPPSRGGVGLDGEGSDPVSTEPPMNRWLKMVPLSACRGESYLSYNEPENRLDDSAQVTDSSTSSVDAPVSGSGPHNGVPSGAPALLEMPPGPAGAIDLPGSGVGRTSAHYTVVGRGCPARSGDGSRDVAAVTMEPGNGPHRWSPTTCHPPG